MPRPRGDDGTSALELVGFLPIVAVLLVALIQGGVGAYAVAATQDAARNAALASARGGDVQDAADRSVPVWLDTTVVPLGPAGAVRVDVDVPDIVPGVDLRVSRRAVLPAGVTP